MTNGLGAITLSTYDVDADIDRSGAVDSADQSKLSSANPTSALALGELSDIDNNVGWNGYLYNVESRDYCVRFRHYDTDLGRWLQRDPLGYIDGMSRYGYLAGSPLGALDPAGLSETAPGGSELARLLRELSDKMNNPHFKIKASTDLCSDLMTLLYRLATQRKLLDLLSGTEDEGGAFRQALNEFDQLFGIAKDAHDSLKDLGKGAGRAGDAGEYMTDHYGFAEDAYKAIAMCDECDDYLNELSQQLKHLNDHTLKRLKHLAAAIEAADLVLKGMELGDRGVGEEADVVELLGDLLEFFWDTSGGIEVEPGVGKAPIGSKSFAVDAYIDYVIAGIEAAAVLMEKIHEGLMIHNFEALKDGRMPAHPNAVGGFKWASEVLGEDSWIVKRIEDCCRDDLN